MSSHCSQSDYDIEIANNFVPLIAEFFRIGTSEARDRLESELREPGRLVAEAWCLVNPQTPSDVLRFYRETQSYVYDLAADHCQVRRRPVRSAVIQRIEGRGTNQNVLLYGDGIGDDSIAIVRRGHNVTYFDLPGITSSFARFRFEKEALRNQIAILTDETEIPNEAYDVVVCIEVLEHVSDPPAVMRTLHRSLNTGGIALITESFDSVGPEYPSHLPQNFKYAGKTHRLMERLGFANTYYNRDPVNRPMEFTKIQSGLKGDVMRLRYKLRRAIDTRWRRPSQKVRTSQPK